MASVNAQLSPQDSSAPANLVPIARHLDRTVELDLDLLMAGRLLIQGTSGAGKSLTLRKIIEESFEYSTVMILDPEGEFGNLASHIGATCLRAGELTAEGLTAAAVRGRAHRINLHLDLSDLDPEQRILRACAFLSGLVSVPTEHWAHTVLLAIDEAHLLAPHIAGQARDAEIRRTGVATLTDVCARGRKRGIAPVIATQRLAKLATSVLSELHNFLIGINVLDRDIARAADLLGFDRLDTNRFRELRPGDFYAFGPAIAPRPILVKVDLPVTEHLGFTPGLTESQPHSPEHAAALLDLGGLQETGGAERDHKLMAKGRNLVDAFLLDRMAIPAARIVGALKAIAPSATTHADLAAHLALPVEDVDSALDLLSAMAIIEAMPRGDGRIARLHTRLRRRLSDINVVGLA